MTCKLFDRRARLVARDGWSILVLLFLTVIIQSNLLHAEEYRHHEAHEHGVASMNIAVEGNNLYIEFSSPAANIVGFEHHPRTQAQKETVQDALKQLQSAKALFILSAGAQSQLLSAAAETDIDDEPDHHAASEHGQAKGEHYEKKPYAADEHERHSEFKARYHFICKKPGRLSEIEVGLFRVFSGIERIEVQLVSETKQAAMELTARMYKIPL